MHKLEIVAVVAGLLVMMATSGSVASDGPDQALIEAAAKMDLGQVRNLLDKGANVNARSEQGWTALMKACASGDVDVVKLLLDKGADVNAKDYEGTALIKASSFGRLDVVRLLLKRGADVNATDREGRTALTEACKEGDKEKESEIGNLLKAHGATATVDGSEQAMPDGAMDRNLVATWELLSQTDEHGQNEQKPIENIRSLIEFTNKGVVVFSRIEKKVSDRTLVRTGKYRIERNEVVIADEAGNIVRWPYKIADDKLTIVMAEFKKKHYWRRVR
jgi:ankyrin repeat protein